MFFLLVLCNSPEEIPIHFDINGYVDRYGSKWELIVLPCLAGLNFFILSIIKKVISKDDENRGKIVCDLFAIFINMVIIWALYYIASISSGNNAIDMRKAFLYLFISISIIISWITKNIKINNKIGLRSVWSLQDSDIWSKCQKIGFINSIIFNVIIIGCIYFIRSMTAMIICIFVGYLLMAISGLIITYIVMKKEKKRHE